ncbi:hypothetical protein [Mycolicibacterium anyangense]|uniref:hypothetical protein n=1 Tax=Mycolicibacterium anyangense TaxID=1431246 RepID=UPI0013D5F1B4|nr:hypothetical protein [Mycolicibacterium anyangense]
MNVESLAVAEAAAGFDVTIAESALVVAAALAATSVAFLPEVAVRFAGVLGSLFAERAFWAVFGDAAPPVALDGPAVDELLDADGPLDPPAPALSADATGIEATAAPTPRATADAPSQVHAYDL